MNPNIARWCKSSIVKHFTTQISSPYLYVEGQDRSVLNGKSQYVELRIDGPVVKQPSKNHFTLNVEINCLISLLGQGDNLYTIDDLIGKVAAAFTDNIPVYKYQTPGDYLGCFILDRDGIFSANFGTVDPDAKVTQASVEGHYKMILDSLE